MNAHQRRIYIRWAMRQLQQDQERRQQEDIKARECPRCHQEGPHWIAYKPFGMSLPAPDMSPILEDEEGFWVCSDLYDPLTGKRIDTSDAPPMLNTGFPLGALAVMSVLDSGKRVVNELAGLESSIAAATEHLRRSGPTTLTELALAAGQAGKNVKINLETTEMTVVDPLAKESGDESDGPRQLDGQQAPE
jgi:hypothetical protein